MRHPILFLFVLSACCRASINLSADIVDYNIDLSGVTGSGNELRVSGFISVDTLLPVGEAVARSELTVEFNGENPVALPSIPGYFGDVASSLQWQTDGESLYISRLTDTTSYFAFRLGSTELSFGSGFNGHAIVYDSQGTRDLFHLKNRTGPDSPFGFLVGQSGSVLDLSAADLNDDGNFDVNDINAVVFAMRFGAVDDQFDLDGDGAVTENDHTVLIKELGRTWFGDANLDGEFSSADLVNVFQAGEYEDSVPVNSTWSEGDWNADGDFTSGDLVRAFQDGGYEQGPRAAVSAVPEPSAAWLAALAATLTVSRTRLKRM